MNIISSLALPFYSKYLNAKLREPDDISIQNIKSRVKSDPVEHEVKKEKQRIDNKLKTEYKKDLQHERIKSEIEKTLQDLYGDGDGNSEQKLTNATSNNKKY
jgi:hypothetical protein